MSGTSKRLFRKFWISFICFAVAITSSISSFALDTPNSIMGIDAMVIGHAGLFRNGDPNDGFNTFQFGTFATAGASLGRYHSFYLVKTGDGACCISHRNRIETFTPEVFVDTDFVSVSGDSFSIDSDYFPVIDRAAFGQVFDPTEYQLEAKFKPNIGVTGLPDNMGTTLGVSVDQHFGFVWDAEDSTYKRATEQIFFNFGTDELPINDWYAAAEKDADGFATWTIPFTEHNGSSRSFYYNYGDGDFRNDFTLSGGGREFDSDAGQWVDVNVGYGEGFQMFGGGPEDPSNPGSKLNTPNGFSLMAFGAPGDDPIPLSVEIKSLSIKKINPSPIVARVDGNSGLSYRFGTGFTRPLSDPITLDGFPMLPRATDQISRFDENGITNLIIDMREPDDPSEVHRFFIRQAPGANTFDGTDAVVSVRAKLTEPLGEGIADSLQIVAKDLDGNDQAVGEGAEEYFFDVDLNQFNTDDFTTVSIPLADFSRNATALIFANEGDNSLADFNLYEFGGRLEGNSGLLKLEIEFMEIRLPETGIPGDFDHDDDVDGYDFLVWQRDTSVGSLSDWEMNYGTGTSPLASVAIPEPSSLLLAVLGMALFCRRTA